MPRQCIYVRLMNDESRARPDSLVHFTVFYTVHRKVRVLLASFSVHVLGVLIQKQRNLLDHVTKVKRCKSRHLVRYLLFVHFSCSLVSM